MHDDGGGVQKILFVGDDDGVESSCILFLFTSTLDITMIESRSSRARTHTHSGHGGREEHERDLDSSCARIGLFRYYDRHGVDEEPGNELHVFIDRTGKKGVHACAPTLRDLRTESARGRRTGHKVGFRDDSDSERRARKREKAILGVSFFFVFFFFFVLLSLTLAPGSARKP